MDPRISRFVIFLLCSWIVTPVLVLAQNFNLTVAVLVNSANSDGYSTSDVYPGQYQRYAERYFEHLQIPYQVFDVATANVPADLNSRQLIVAAHPGLALSGVWQNAVLAAVKGGTGFVNLDSAPRADYAQHLLAFFNATGFAAGTPGTSITVAAALAPGGTAPHYVAALQWKSPLDTPGAFVYYFHPDQSGNLNTATATLLQNATGTVIARLGQDPLITVTRFGDGRVVNFGTLDYLQADRFGFMMGVDDLFWRSLVWAARKPFVVRGYPRLWSLRMDHNVDTNWWTRVQEMYDPALTGAAIDDGSPWGAGGPWKVTGAVYLAFLPSGDPGRAAIIRDMEMGKIQLSPHSFQSSEYGDLFWNGLAGSLTDAQELNNINAILNWEGRLPGNPIPDPLPAQGLSKWVVGHYYDLSNNLGFDLWNLGFRYVSTTELPGAEYTTSPSETGYLSARLPAHPYWNYQLPPKPANADASDESFSFFFADDFTIGSRAGLPAKKFFLTGSRTLDTKLAGVPDVGWCNGFGDNLGLVESKFEWYTWRLYSSLAPVELYTHDDSFYGCVNAPVNRRFALPPSNASLRGGLSPNASQQVIQDVSNWLAARGTHQVFMQDLAQYSYARTKSSLVAANFDGVKVTYTFTGSAVDPDGNLVTTQVLVFSGDDEGEWQSVPGFTAGSTVSMNPPPPPPPPPVLNSVDPSSGSSAGGAVITISGSGFVPSSIVTIGGVAAANLQFISNTTLTAVTPAIAPGITDLSVSAVNGASTLKSAFTFLGPPAITRISPTSGPSWGGNIVDIYGTSFTPDTTITIGGTPLTNLKFISPGFITAIAPADAIGAQAAISVVNPAGTMTMATPYIYMDPATILLQESFNGDGSSAWSISPLGSAGNWNIVNHAKDYSGINESQIYAGDGNWQDYSFEVKVRLFALQNYPGGIRARVSPSTGAGYAVWMYPGNNEIRLFRATAWNIDSPGLTTLASATINFDTNGFHAMRLAVQGPTIQVFWDGVAILSATDSTYATGAIALDVSNQHVEFEDALVTSVVSTSP